MNSVEPKIENIDCEEPKPEKVDANENQTLTAQNCISQENTVLTKEKNTEQVLLICNKKSLTTDSKDNSGKDLKILPVPGVNKTSCIQNLITDSQMSTSQSIQKTVNDSLSKEKDISMYSNGHGNSTGKQLLLSTVSNDSDSDNYEVETLDEDLLASEESLRNGEKIEYDPRVIEIFDDSDLSEDDAKYIHAVESIKSSGNNNN